ncbi:MAG: DUF899 domain-containing protein [Betaproteobacteria bacterium]|nr:DUF899 domain-containing protein [Betaproteobacteria bacterium]
MESKVIAHHPVVSPEDWLAARLRLLEREKELTRLRDAVAAERRALPWERVVKPYRFQGPDGEETLASLCRGNSQLIVYHFMLGAGWKEGCPSCSFMSDHVDGALPHLAARDVSYVAVSRAPLEEIEAFRRRMGWRFRWVSSHGNDFNIDFRVSPTPGEKAQGRLAYNYGEMNFSGDELPGASVFCKDATGDVFHTYSTYGRGLDLLIGSYNWLDLVPKGRDEDGLKYSMAWVRHHDRYQDPPESTDDGCGAVKARV